MKNIKTIIGIIFATSLISCKKFTEIPPPKTSLVSSSVFANATTANQAQMGIYAQMGGNSFLFQMAFYPGLSGDEITCWSTISDDIAVYQNALTAQNSNTNKIWSSSYQFIFQANAVIEGAKASSTLNSAVVQELVGEAEFTRAYLYFYLVNLYGDVPLITTTDYNQTNQTPRTSAAAVYQQIISDLKDAETKLNSRFVGADGLTTSTERIRPTKWAASALLARVYLFQNDWQNAYNESSLVIGNSSQFSLVQNLNNVFKINSSEAIWQISEAPFNTITANRTILTGAPTRGTISQQLYNAFENNDARKANWIKDFTVSGTTYHYGFKYQFTGNTNLQEYDMMLRLAEQYLIRAEAQANGSGNGLSGAINDLNIIRTRASLPNYNGSATDKSTILNAIMHERQVELFTEFGHRWLDLKRTKTIDNIMPAVMAIKGNIWDTRQQLWPLPQADILADQKLTQNPGY